ncbi:hypothetical protein [Mycobacterium sp. HM-7]
MKSIVSAIALLATTLVSMPLAQADIRHGNFELRMSGRPDFHTWLWALSSCRGDCVHVQAIPQPVAKAFAYQGDAQMYGGRFTLTVDVPDGLRCGDIYYGPVIPTRDTYSWDVNTMSGTLSSSFATGCDGSPAGTSIYPFDLIQL